MTDRYSGFVVTLEDDIRSDDAEAVTKAISMVKGVLTVRPNLGGSTTCMAEDRVKHRYYVAMHDAVRSVFDGNKTAPPETPRRSFMEPWQWSAILLVSLAAALAIIVVGIHMKDAHVEALQKMEKACAGQVNR